MGKLEGKRPLGTPRRICADIIKMGLREVRWVGVDWIDLAENRDRWQVVVSAVLKLRVPEHAGNFLTS